MPKNRLSKFFFPFSFFLFLSSFIFNLSSCQRSTEPLFNTANLQLRVLDVSCTETWLSLKAELAEKTEQDSSDLKLQLYRNDSLILNKPFTTSDSIVYVDGLWPNTNYQFLVTIYNGSNLLAKSSTVSATTMDTTSHNFAWKHYLFGDVGTTSILRDVTVIQNDYNKLEIWAVGEIKTDSGRYNAVHWDEEKRELKKVYFYLCPNNSSPFQYPIQSVFAFGKNDVWFARGGSITHWNGSKFIHDCSINQILTGSINKIWGTSDKDLYVVGNNGLIAHYDGRQWQRIESGTDLNIYDIWGARAENGNYEILCAASKHLEDPLFRRKIFKIEHNHAHEVPTEPIQWGLSSIWFVPNRKYYAAGDGIFTNYRLSGTPWNIDLFYLSDYYIYRIRGTALNDIYAVGGCGEFLHFNGLSWKSFLDEQMKYQRQYYSMDVDGNTVVAVGYQGVQALITIGIK